MVTITTFHIEMLGVGYILYIVLNCHKIRTFFKGKTVLTEYCYMYRTDFSLAYVHSSEKVSIFGVGFAAIGLRVQKTKP